MLSAWRHMCSCGVLSAAVAQHLTRSRLHTALPTLLEAPGYSPSTLGYLSPTFSQQQWQQPVGHQQQWGQQRPYCSSTSAVETQHAEEQYAQAKHFATMTDATTAALKAQQQQPQQEQQQQNKQHQQEEQDTNQQQQQEQQPDEQPLEGPNGLLAEWRLESSRWYSQVFRMVVNQSIHYPQFCTWSQLYQSQPPGLLSRLLVAEGSSALTWPLSRMYRQHSLIAEFLLSQAHADFDADSFREGVKQALEYTTSLYAASDWVSLKPLVSAALLKSMRFARQQQADAMEADDVTVTDIELVIDVDSIQLVSASAVTRDQLAVLDQDRANEPLPLIPVAADNEESATVDAAASAVASAASAATAAPVAEGAADQTAWDLAHVYAEGVLHTQVAKAGEKARQVELLKRGHWVLARGPVHIDRVLSSDVASSTPWFVLTWL